MVACSAAPVETASAPTTPTDAPQPPATIYVLRRGWHTDLVLSVDELRGPVATLGPAFPGARYLIFGFGDRQYMLATHRNLGHLLLAPLPGAGILLITGLRDAPAEVYGAEHVQALSLGPAQLAALDAFLWQSLEPDGDGTVHPYMQGNYAGNVYYSSSKTYDGLYTCNTWTAEALKSGGLPVRSAGVLFAGQVWDQAQAVSRRSEAEGATPRD
ncbi:MAG: DUF2459 domain-containing protein [Nevskia sp.]|nr:DUF2459 domain-containing protein [Nevskia sp.]